MTACQAIDIRRRLTSLLIKKMILWKAQIIIFDR